MLVARSFNSGYLKYEYFLRRDNLLQKRLLIFGAIRRTYARKALRNGAKQILFAVRRLCVALKEIDISVAPLGLHYFIKSFLNRTRVI
jgi:hypothetical protein